MTYAVAGISTKQNDLPINFQKNIGVGHRRILAKGRVGKGKSRVRIGVRSYGLLKSTPEPHGSFPPPPSCACEQYFRAFLNLCGQKYLKGSCGKSGPGALLSQFDVPVLLLEYLLQDFAGCIIPDITCQNYRPNHYKSFLWLSFPARGH